MITVEQVKRSTREGGHLQHEGGVGTYLSYVGMQLKGENGTRGNH